MLSQPTKTFVVIDVAVCLGYRYKTRDAVDQSEIFYYPNKVTQVSIGQLDKIKCSTPPVIMDRKLSAFMLGATGAVGKEVVRLLAADSRFDRVTLIGRRPVTLSHEENPGYQKIVNQLIDFENLDEYKDVFKGYDVGFSSLGTSRRKSGAKGFYRVDHDYVVQTAKLAKEGGCQHLHIVSAFEANKNSCFLYPKTKGQVEEELSEMDFPRLSIYRPGLLLLVGRREECRVVERVAQCLLKVFDRKRRLSIYVPMLARVMVENCFRESSSKTEVIENVALNKFAKEIINGNRAPSQEQQQHSLKKASFVS